MIGSGCKNCPVSPRYTLYYRGFNCREQRAKHGLGDPMTNADRIRSMSDEELSVFLCEEFDCGSKSCPGLELCKTNEGKANGLLKWLQRPAEKPKEEA